MRMAQQTTTKSQKRQGTKYRRDVSAGARYTSIRLTKEEAEELASLGRALAGPYGLHIPQSVVIKYAIRKALEAIR